MGNQSSLGLEQAKCIDTATGLTEISLSKILSRKLQRSVVVDSLTSKKLKSSDSSEIFLVTPSYKEEISDISIPSKITVKKNKTKNKLLDLEKIVLSKTDILRHTFNSGSKIRTFPEFYGVLDSNLILTKFDEGESLEDHVKHLKGAKVKDTIQATFKEDLKKNIGSFALLNILGNTFVRNLGKFGLNLNTPPSSSHSVNFTKCLNKAYEYLNGVEMSNELVEQIKDQFDILSGYISGNLLTSKYQSIVHGKALPRNNRLNFLVGATNLSKASFAFDLSHSYGTSKEFLDKSQIEQISGFYKDQINQLETDLFYPSKDLGYDEIIQHFLINSIYANSVMAADNISQKRRNSEKLKNSVIENISNMLKIYEILEQENFYGLNEKDSTVVDPIKTLYAKIYSNFPE